MGYNTIIHYVSTVKWKFGVSQNEAVIPKNHPLSVAGEV